ncbi:MAG: AIR synthase-related protein [Desulfobulbus sp.]|nr:AIR synthase-related protein [Desulfobulbus sp.]
MNPRARVELGGQLGASGLIHAMMDISDGLSTDLAHLCAASAVGGQFSAEQLPGNSLLAQAAHLTGHDPLQWAIAGGEDFELLFTAAPESASQIRLIGQECGLKLFPIGTIRLGKGVSMLCPRPDGTLLEQSVSYQGFDHFRDECGG